MEIRRMISTSFWSDSTVVDDFTPEDRYMFLYLMTNTYTDITGAYEISIKQMARDTGYNEESIQRLLKRLIKQHKVIDYDFENKEVLIINWHKYNWTRSPKLLKAVSNRLTGIKTERFRNYIEHLVETDDTLSIGYQYTMDTTISNTISNTITNTKTKTNNNNQNKQRSSLVFGSQNNVYLNQSEIQKLEKDYPDLYQEYIESLSLYLAQTGKRYKSHDATIRNWIRRDLKKQETSGKKIIRDTGYLKQTQHASDKDMGAIKAALKEFYPDDPNLKGDK